MEAVITISGSNGIKCEAETLQVLVSRINAYISNLPEDCDVSIEFRGTVPAEWEDDLK